MAVLSSMSRYLTGPPRSPRLEEVLHGDADLALSATDRLLEHLRVEGVWRIDADRILKFAIWVKHEISLGVQIGVRPIKTLSYLDIRPTGREPQSP